MCHNCPVCGELCYCDMDDLFLEENSEKCLHYTSRECIDPDDIPDDDELESFEDLR